MVAMNATKLHTIFLLLAMGRPAFSSESYKHEARIIMQRMAQANHVFDGHDVATVHVTDDQGQVKHRLVKRDIISYRRENQKDGGLTGNISSLKLYLSSGSKVTLKLIPSGIVSEETIVSYQAANGRMVRKPLATDCLSHGKLGDSSGKGWAAISHCDGLFGFANSPDFDYFLHPADVHKTKLNVDDDYDVHVMWRRSTSRGESPSNETIDPLNGNLQHDSMLKSIDQLEMAHQDTRGKSDLVVIEMAMFSDAQYWQQLQKLYPGREDDFLLTRLAAAQSLYGDKEKVGYKVRFKLKLLEYWITNPQEYTFAQRLSQNLRSSCRYTREKHFYDIHILNTGISYRSNGKVGLAYGSGACSRVRCFVSLSVNFNSFVLYAHELGHTLGLSHHSSKHCPDKLKSPGGFMGGGMPYNFSPCMKVQLAQFLNTSKSDCLFSESNHIDERAEFNDMPKVFPGQIRSPNELCQLIAGVGYEYVVNTKSVGSHVCQWMVCLMVNQTQPQFGRVRRFHPPIGFPCMDEGFCMGDKSCKAWTDTTISPTHLEVLRKMNRKPTWSEWSLEHSSCSRSCGIGVRARKRDCLISGFNLAPYCEGPSVSPELCNLQPCPEDPTTFKSIRRARGDEVCSRIQNDAVLSNRKKGKELPPMSPQDMLANISRPIGSTCLLTCKLNMPSFKDDYMAFLPDGTPCRETERSLDDLKVFNVDLRCVTGLCMEFSDCPKEKPFKDKCGICGGDGSRCVDLKFDSSYVIAKGKRRILATIPMGSSDINVRIERSDNTGVVLELWSADGQNIIGYRGLHPRKIYFDSTAVPFAGTIWSYRRNEAYLRASGPTKEKVVVKALRINKPITNIWLVYTLGRGRRKRVKTRVVSKPQKHSDKPKRTQKSAKKLKALRKIRKG